LYCLYFIFITSIKINIVSGLCKDLFCALWSKFWQPRNISPTHNIVPVELLPVRIVKAHPGSPHYSYHKTRDTIVATDLKILASSSFVSLLQIK
jgi:hypothetical protein